MRLIPSAATGPQAVLHLVAQICRCPALAPTKRYGNSRCMRSIGKRVTGITRLRIAAVRGAGDLRGVECHWQYMPRINRLIAGKVSGVMAVWASVARKRSNDVRHQRRAPPSAVLAGIEAFAAQAVRNIGRLVVAVQRRRHVGTDFGAGLTRGYADGSNWNHVTCCGMVCAV